MNLRHLNSLYTLNLIKLDDITNVITAKYSNHKIFDKFIDLYYLNSRSQPNEVISVLTKLGSKITYDEFNDFNEKLMNCLYNMDVDWNKKRTILIEHWKTNNEFLEKDYEFYSMLSDDLHLRQDGFSGCLKMPEDLNKYLKKFSFNKNYSINDLLIDILSGYPPLPPRSR